MKIDLTAIKTRFGIIGNSLLLNHALEVSTQVAPTDLSVFIVGESGVGKEVFSLIIHKLSTRKHEKFIAINCGAIPEGTIDSELFGHEKGSFTGAEREREGYFEKVNNGTIFLDEIGEMPLGTQARLLRILETGEYIRVGSSQVKKTNVRVIAATNRDLHGEIEKGKFRKDLFYRLNTIPIYVPSLRERQEDIPLLFKKFCIDFAQKYHANTVTLDDEAISLLQKYKWEGNVRQLKNVAEQVSVLENAKIINAKTIQQYLPTHPNQLVVLDKIEEKKIPTEEVQMLYKLFIELKAEVNTIKKVILDSGTGGISNNQKLVNETLDTKYMNRLLDEASHKLLLTKEESEGKNLVPKILPSSGDLSTNLSSEQYENLNIAEMERNFIVKALERNAGKKRNAANELGISERTLYRKIKDYNINF